MPNETDPHLAALFQRVQLNPGAAEPLHQYGNALREAGQLEDALFRLQQALRLAPHTADIHHSLGLVFGRLRRWPDAAAAFKRAINLKPDFSSAHNNLGTALLDMGKTLQAIEAFRACLRFQPTCIEALTNLGVTLAAQNQHDEAIRCFHAALALRPDSAEAHMGLGASLSELGQTGKGMRHFQEGKRLKPNAPNIHNDLGIAFTALNRFEDAVLHFGRAIELQPDYPIARKNRALAWLVQGDFARGWPEYEYRLLEKTPQRQFTQPRWDGSPLEGKTILIYHEQGLGDTIQFVRYLPLVKARGGRVVFECQTALAKLLAGCAGFDQLVPGRSPLPAFDVQVPLMSLPFIFGTTLDSVPASAPYVAADPGLEQVWGEALSRVQGFKVAIAWQGNPDFKRDRLRSIPLRQFAPVASVAGVGLISMQKGLGSEQIAGAGFAVLDLGADLDKGGAFSDTAAIFKNVDLVITSDTAIAHVAGALGVPVWLALGFAADWRWLLEREDCPWYPTMRLFRQKRTGDWSEVFERMAAEVGRASLPVQRRTAREGRPTEEKEVGRASLPVPERRTAREGRPTQTRELAVALLALGKALAQQGQHEEAAECFTEVLRLHPGSAQAEANLGLACLNLGRTGDAIAPLQRSLKLRPNPDVHCTLGVAFFRLQRLDDAIVHYRQAVRLEPRHADAHHNLGNALRLTGQLDVALASFNEAKRLRPGVAETHFLIGQILEQQGKHAEAVEAFRNAIKHNAGQAAVHLHLGNALATLNRCEEALTVLRTAARLDPNNGEVPFRIANCLYQQGKLEDAVDAHRAALRLSPGAFEGWLNLGATLAGLERFEEAESAYRDGLRCRPDDTGLINNLGVALKNQLRFEEALACFAEALRLEPEYVEAHRNRALTRLQLGDMEQGWPEHEWRLRKPDRPGPRFSQPRWDGTDLAGRTILLYPEQGIGDTIQFIRYAALLKAQGARVLFLCPPFLTPLFRRYEGIDGLVAPDGPMLPFDVYASLMSLPFLTSQPRERRAEEDRRSRFRLVGECVPYLSSAPELEERWGQVLDGMAGFKVGISWQGNPDYSADRGRSIPLRYFAPLAQVAGVQLVSLQKGPGVEQLAEFTKPILSFDRQADEAAGAFMDTAAMMRRLDLVITSDTAIAHLAGALGVPVWVVLSQSPDWRWQLEREDSPWYPTMRLFRQKRRGDWHEVFGRVAVELQSHVQSIPEITERWTPKPDAQAKEPPEPSLARQADAQTKEPPEPSLARQAWVSTVLSPLQRAFARSPVVYGRAVQIATVCILTYGDYLDYFRRCLDAVLACTPPDEITLRLGFNDAPGSLAYALEKLQPTSAPARRQLPGGVELIQMHTRENLAVSLWTSPINLYKEPMARLMFYSQPLQTEYVVWFDDDSFVSAGWYPELRKLLDQRVDYIGQDWWVRYLPGQRDMIRQQPWYRGVPFAERAGRAGVRFMTGGFLAIRTACLQAANYPDTAFRWNGETLKQYGGDTLLGEIARQLHWTRAPHSTHIHVNVDLEGRHPAPRRGGIGRQFGSDIDVIVQ